MARNTTSKRNKIPDRWEDYLPIGKRLSNTRFITFKVPLKKGLCDKLENTEEFSPDSLLAMCEADNWSLGLVIDLTNTTRYYNPKEFLDHGVEYQKIFTEGHVVPSNDVILKFSAAVDDYIGRNDESDKLIGVHCTHGVNRTGYLVCRYMIDRLSIEPDEAINIYADSRGYPVERENYLTDLRSGIKIKHQEYEAYKAENPVQPYDPYNPASNKPRDQFNAMNRQHGNYYAHDIDIRGRRNVSHGNRYGLNSNQESYDFRQTYTNRVDNTRSAGRYHCDHHSNQQLSIAHSSRDSGASSQHGTNNRFNNRFSDYERPSNGYNVRNQRSNDSYGSYGHRHGNDDYGSYGRRHNFNDNYELRRSQELVKGSPNEFKSRRNRPKSHESKHSSRPGWPY